MRHFIFCHGFGFDNSFWCNLAPYFMQEKCTYLDLGYFGEGYFPEIIKNDDLLIGVGHSLGMAKLLQLDIKFDYLIGLNAFSNFLGNDSSLRMKRKADLEILKKHFTKYPKKSLKEFHRRCGVSIAIGDQKIDGRKLLWDLDFLEINFKIPEHIPKAVGKLDSILSGEHSECTEKYMSTRIHDKIEKQFFKCEGYKC